MHLPTPPKVSRGTIYSIAGTVAALVATCVVGMAVELLREVCAALVLHWIVALGGGIKKAIAEKKGGTDAG